MRSPLYILLVFLLGSSCMLYTSCSESAKTNADNLTDSLFTDTVQVEITKDTVSKTIEYDPFYALVDLAKDSLISWGFELQEEPVILEPESYRYHWYLKHYMRPNHHARDTMPSQSALQQFQVRQAVFKKQWKFLIEEWKFESRDDAESWMHIINRNYRMDDQKPPRELWLDNNRIYFVVATAAKDWFEHGKELVELLTERDLYLVRLLNNPLNVADFKESKGGSNSGNRRSKHHFTPSSPGMHYYFSLFNTPLRIPEYKRLGGLVIETYKYAEVAGDYFDKDEILVGIYANYQDRDLGRMNWVNQPLATLMDQLGEPHYEDPEKIIYFQAQRLLAFQIENDSVMDFRFKICDSDLSENNLLTYAD